MSAHAFLAPSGAHRWGPDGCPGSAWLLHSNPQGEDSEEAREGTAAHHYAAETIMGRHVKEGDLAPNGVPISADMIAATADYIAEARALIADCAANGGQWFVESRVTMRETVSEFNYGTPDFYAFWPALRKVRLLDYKHGHRYVDAFRNWQLADYLVGVFETHRLGPICDGWDIAGIVHQPRNYHPEGPRRQWTPSGGMLEDMAHQLHEAAKLACDPQAHCLTGDHCRDCPVAGQCTTLQTTAGYLVDMSGERLDHALDNDALGSELTFIRAAIKRLGTRAEGLEEQALNRIAQGQRVKGWTGEHSYGREKFVVPPEKVIALGNLYGVDLKAPLATVTPNQARTKGMPADVLGPGIVEKPRGAYTLVAVTPHSLAKGLSNHG